VEDKGFYDAVRDGLLKLVNCGEGPTHTDILKSDLDYLQERKNSGLCFRRYPEIIEGRISEEEY